MNDTEVRQAEERLREKTSEFEDALDKLMGKVQESSRLLRNFSEEAAHIAENVKKPGAFIQPYLEEGLHLTEDFIKKYAQEKRTTLENYVNESMRSIEEGTNRLLKNFGNTLKSQVEHFETRPLIPGVALFLGGFLLGGLALGRTGRRVSEPGAVAGLRRRPTPGTAIRH